MLVGSDIQTTSALRKTCHWCLLWRWMGKRLTTADCITSMLLWASMLSQYQICDGTQATIFPQTTQVYAYLRIHTLLYPLSPGMTTLNAFKTLLSVNQKFERFEAEGKGGIMLFKLQYLGLALLGLAMAGWKLNSMGLVPVKSSDWIAMVPIPQVIITCTPTSTNKRGLSLGLYILVCWHHDTTLHTSKPFQYQWLTCILFLNCFLPVEWYFGPSLIGHENGLNRLY